MSLHMWMCFGIKASDCGIHWIKMIPKFWKMLYTYIYASSYNKKNLSITTTHCNLSNATWGEKTHKQIILVVKHKFLVANCSQSTTTKFFKNSPHFVLSRIALAWTSCNIHVVVNKVSSSVSYWSGLSAWEVCLA